MTSQARWNQSASAAGRRQRRELVQAETVSSCGRARRVLEDGSSTQPRPQRPSPLLQMVLTLWGLRLPGICQRRPGNRWPW